MEASIRGYFAKGKAMRRSSKRFSRNGREHIWCSANSNNFAVAAGGILDFKVVEMVTDMVVGSSQAHATFVRLRGSFSWCPVDTAVVAPMSLLAYCGVFDDDEIPPDPNSISTYSDEDILWTYAGQAVVNGGTAPATTSGKVLTMGSDVQVDIKAKRKLRTGQTLHIVMGPTNAAMRVSAIFRGLILPA